MKESSKKSSKKSPKSEKPEQEKRKKILLSWSGGKDSATALFELKSPEYEIVGLLSLFDANSDRLLLQDLSRSLVEAQAAALDIPLFTVALPSKPSNAVWMEKMSESLEGIRKKIPIEGLAFGDSRLEDVKKWRENACSSWNLEAVFPLWGWSPDLIHQAFFGLGHQAVVHCIDPKRVPPAFLGRMYNPSFVRDLPPSVDSCGVNSEFHTCVLDGPFFTNPLKLDLGAIYEKEGYQYRELKLLNAPLYQ